MSGDPPKYSQGAGYFPPPPEKGAPSGQGQSFPPPPGASSSQSFPPPPGASSAQYPPPPTGGSVQFAPPPGAAPASTSAPPNPIAAAAEQKPLTPSQNVGGAPPAQHFVGAQTTVDDIGTFNGGSYRISHRDSNTILTLQLAMGCPINAKPGSLLAMSPSVHLKGASKFTLKKLVAGGDFGQSTYTGPGEILLAPASLGDITNIRLDGNNLWSVARDGYLCSTQGVVKDYKSQGLTKGMFSGEGLFIYKISGQGIVFITSMGAIIRKDLQEGEKYIVDNGYLVAWNCQYILERVTSGGIMSEIASKEGLVCKFTGPGTIFIQTRNAAAFAASLNQTIMKTQ